MIQLPGEDLEDFITVFEKVLFGYVRGDDQTWIPPLHNGVVKRLDRARIAVGQIGSTVHLREGLSFFFFVL